MRKIVPFELGDSGVRHVVDVLAIGACRTTALCVLLPWLRLARTLASEAGAGREAST